MVAYHHKDDALPAWPYLVLYDVRELQKTRPLIYELIAELV